MKALDDSPATQLALRSGRLCRFALAVLAAILASAATLPAQVRSNTATVNLAAILGSSISVSASPGLVNFTLPPGEVELIALSTTPEVPVAAATAFLPRPGAARIPLLQGFDPTRGSQEKVHGMLVLGTAAPAAEPPVLRIIITAL